MTQLKCYMKDQGAELPKKRWTLLQFNIKLFRVGRLASGITGTGPVGENGFESCVLQAQGSQQSEFRRTWR